ncbi:hypothetical protein AAFN85_29855 [Mucilaginibacter sp. CAU 1740]|uniref:hypothetical protein n=1 Tax=Mucilaginibacter sp. CAU 1740 TaxID=3140365 RepID=UPI00325BE549
MPFFFYWGQLENCSFNTVNTKFIMGQRANYIITENNTRTIYYNHWRANCITSDLYLGKARFIEFAKSCRQVEVMLDEVWIEGCVLVNIDKKIVHFWSFEYAVTSVTGFYLKKLRDRWKGWEVNFLYNQMYDVERILNIDYLSKQELIGITACTSEEILNDEFNEWAGTLILLKETDQIYISHSDGWLLEGILAFGEPVVDVLRKK